MALGRPAGEGPGAAAGDRRSRTSRGAGTRAEGSPARQGRPANPLCGNGPRQREILALLAGGALSARDIAQEIGVPLAHVYTHLSKLVARGLIERHGPNRARSFTLPAAVRRAVIEAPAHPMEGAAPGPGPAPAAGAGASMREGLEKALRAVLVEAAERLAERVARTIAEGDLWRE